MSINQISLSDEQKKLFDINIDSRIVNFVVNWQLAKRRSGNHAVKNMSTVHGTNKKPHNQKGGGRARQGSKKAPHMRGGAVSMGPVTRDHSFKINKKIKTLGLKMIIADKIKHDALIILDQFPNISKTRDIISLFPEKRTLFIVNDNHDSFIKSVRNVKNFDILHSNGLNVYSIIKNTILVFDKSTLNDMLLRIGGRNDS